MVGTPLIVASSVVAMMVMVVVVVMVVVDRFHLSDKVRWYFYRLDQYWIMCYSPPRNLQWW